MREYPISGVCPDCGSSESRPRSRLHPTHRICLQCSAQYLRPTPLGKRIFLSLLLLLPGLALAGLAAYLGVEAMEAEGRRDAGWSVMLVLIGMLLLFSLVFVVQGLRVLRGRKPQAMEEDDWESDRILEDPNWKPPLIPLEHAEEIVMEVAGRHGATRVMRLLGNLPPRKVAKAITHYAEAIGDDETPLFLVDDSFLQNGKAGLLLTNRALYSSRRGRPIWLGDVYCVEPREPDSLDPLLFHLFRGAYVIAKWRDLQYRLCVNDKVVFASNKRLNTKFWQDVLMELAAAAREQEAKATEARRAGPRITVLETTQRSRSAQTDDMTLRRRFSWRDIDQSIRDLDGEDRTSVRLWVSEPEVRPVLEILGGNGRYALRELPDGWVYYDADADDREIYVTNTHRFPAFYVCKDLEQVLRIARHFYETGAFE